MVTIKKVMKVMGILITTILIGGGYYMLSCHWMEIPDEAQSGITVLITGIVLLMIMIFWIGEKGIGE